MRLCAPLRWFAVAVAVSLGSGGCLGAEAASRPIAESSPRVVMASGPGEPHSAPPAAAHANASGGSVERTVDSWSLEKKIASLLMLHRPGTDGGALATFVDEYGLGGLILMGDNIPGSPGDLQNLTRTVNKNRDRPILIATDEEGGIVTRLPHDTLPGAETLRAQPSAMTRGAFADRGDLLAGVGISVNFGIVADVTDDPTSFIVDRTLGSTPDAAAERVAAAVRGENGRVFSTLKHFPGHGGAPGDSHHEVPRSHTGIDEWRSHDGVPFAAGADAGAELVMFGHLAYQSVDPEPATLSPRWHRLLRDELDFDGVSITDDMLMLQATGIPEYADPDENAIRALAAGNDMLLWVLPGDPGDAGIDVRGMIGAISAAVRDGRLDEAAIDTSARRLLELRDRVARGQ